MAERQLFACGIWDTLLQHRVVSELCLNEHQAVENITLLSNCPSTCLECNQQEYCNLIWETTSVTIIQQSLPPPPQHNSCSIAYI